MDPYKVIVKGDLETLPNPFTCQKCGATFKVRKDAIKQKITDYERRYYRNLTTGFTCGGCYGYVEAGQKTTEYIVCPTTGCCETFEIQTYNSSGFEDHGRACQIL